MYDTAGETPFKICNVGTTPIDPPSQTYTIFVLTG
jgi:hypothetical protein